MKNTLNRQLDNQEPYISAESDNGPLAIATIRIGLRESLANGRLIVRAVNAHDELLAAAIVALQSLRAWNSMSVPPGIRAFVEQTYEAAPEIKALVAAIAKAEAE